MTDASLKPSVPLSKRPAGRILRALAGGLVGFLAMMAVTRLAGPLFTGPKSPDMAVALAVAVIYVLIGLFVLLGTLMPRAGAHVLNVADADELKDERPVLLGSSISSILTGVALFAMTMAQPIGPLAPPIALVTLAVAMGYGLYSLLGDKAGTDEFRTLVNAQCSQLAFALSFALFGGWAALAHLGYAPMFGPLMFIAGTLALVIVAAFWVAARKGMLSQP